MGIWSPRESPGNSRPPATGAKIPSDRLLVAPPGNRVVIEHASGCTITMAGNLAEFSPPPVQDVTLKIVPANAVDKDLAWSAIRTISSKAVTLGAARNGNGPVRVSTYTEPDFAASQPLAAIEAKALSRARVPLPAFPEAVRAQAIFVEEVQLAVLGRKSAKDAVASIAERVKPLLPT